MVVREKMRKGWGYSGRQTITREELMQVLVPARAKMTVPKGQPIVQLELCRLVGPGLNTKPKVLLVHLNNKLRPEDRAKLDIPPKPPYKPRDWS